MRSLNRLLDALIARIPPSGWIFLSCLSAVIILAVGMRPQDDLGAVQGLPPGFDKLLHFTAYAGLAACIFRSVYPLSARRPPRMNPGWLLVILIPAAVGVIDEICQGFTPGRASDVVDWMADALAGVCVCALGLWFRSRAARD